MFAIPVIIPTFGITNWTKEELSNTDIKTQKLLTSTGSFHINSDIDNYTVIVIKMVEVLTVL